MYIYIYIYIYITPLTKNMQRIFLKGKFAPFCVILCEFQSNRDFLSFPNCFIGGFSGAIQKLTWKGAGKKHRALPNPHILLESHY